MTDLIQHIIDAVSLGSLYALLALGIALIFGIMNLINFAYGELIMIGAFACICSRGCRGRSSCSRWLRSRWSPRWRWSGPRSGRSAAPARRCCS